MHTSLIFISDMVKIGEERCWYDKIDKIQEHVVIYNILWVTNGKMLTSLNLNMESCTHTLSLILIRPVDKKCKSVPKYCYLPILFGHSVKSSSAFIYKCVGLD